MIKKLKQLSKKTWLIIAGVAVVVALIAIGTIIAVNSGNGQPDVAQDSGEITATDDDDIKPPAENTDDLIENLNKMEAEISSDTISFVGDIAINTGDKIAVWLYSEPKFLGFFEIKEKDGVKYIEGLDAAIKKVGVDAGNHNIAIITENGAPIGYIDIVISGNQMTGPTDTGNDEEETSGSTNNTGNNSSNSGGGSSSNNSNSNKPKPSGGNGNTNNGNSSSDTNNNQSSDNSGGGSTSAEPTTPTTPTAPRADYNLNDNIPAEVAGGLHCTQGGFYDVIFHPDPAGAFCDDSIDANYVEHLYVIINGKKYSRYPGEILDSRQGYHATLDESICSIFSLSCARW